MQLSKIYGAMLAIGLVAGLQGCSENEGRNTRVPFEPDHNAAPAGTYSGQVMDGYLRQAVVWIDINNNRLQDASEPVTETGAEGKFTFTKEQLTDLSRPKAYPLGVKALAGYTVDEDTGTAVDRDFLLWGPAIPAHVYRLVSPFTTLIKAERDMQTYDSSLEIYAKYNPPSEVDLVKNYTADANAVQAKLGTAINLQTDYLIANDPQAHIYAQALVRAMQDLVENEGGLVALERSPSDPLKDRIKTILDRDEGAKPADEVKALKAKEIATLTGLTEANVTAVIDSSALADSQAKAQHISDLVADRAVQPRIDALARVLVNQGHWVISSVDKAAGESPTKETYRALTLANVEPVNLAILENDPLVVYRKKFYIHPDSFAVSDTEVDLVKLEGDSPFLLSDTLTQVQFYQYDSDGKVRAVKAAGALQDWRREFLLTYPLDLRAIFPLNWDFQLLSDAETQPMSALIAVEYGTANDANRSYLTASYAVDTTGATGTPDGEADENWTQTLNFPLHNPSPNDPLVHIPSEVWSLHLLQPRVEQDAIDAALPAATLAEMYPGVETVSGETSVGSNDSVLIEDVVENARVTKRRITDKNGKLIRIHGYGYVQERESSLKVWQIKAKSETEDETENEAMARDPDITVNYQTQQTTGRRTQAQVNFSNADIRDYCVVYSYDSSGNLTHQIIQAASTFSCNAANPLMAIGYDYKRLSELLVQ